MALRTALTDTPNCSAIADGSLKGSVVGTKDMGKISGVIGVQRWLRWCAIAHLTTFPFSSVPIAGGTNRTSRRRTVYSVQRRNEFTATNSLGSNAP